MVDLIAHAALSWIAFHKYTRKIIYSAIFFGWFPDIMSWLLLFIFQIYNGVFKISNFGWGEVVPEWSILLYGVSHSIVIFGFVCFFILLFKKKLPLYLFAWPIHILIDIPTHSKIHLPTPFLWPVSSWAFPGLRWSTFKVTSMIWVGIIFLVLLTYIFIQKRKKINYNFMRSIFKYSS